jgi:hypothetical protein
VSWINTVTAWFCGLIKRMCRKTSSEDKDRLKIEYFKMGLHYQIAARYGAAAWLSPEAGNLAHHAIEFFLKGALIEQLDEKARRNFHHDLRKLWRRYKKDRNHPALAKFDQTIRDLNKFERIRYPEEIFRLGMMAEIGFARSPPPPPGQKSPSGERYVLALNEVDELVNLIFRIESINPKFFMLNEHAKRYLDHQNMFPM